ncbi:hypothetical protein [Paucibacter soli]|uniref:hypothetical protein n=1 Tax=Paucibacter soli TaxID=3133433 RepID=UPI0030B5A023
MCPNPAHPDASPQPERAADGPAPATSSGQQRLEQLFRYALRHGQINPLLYAVQHYRSTGRPA